MTDAHPIEAVNHCRDCCCARSWKALGIAEFTGKSIPEHIDLLRIVAEAAKALVGSVHPSLSLTHELVDERALTALESALAAAGYDMTEEEFHRELSKQGA